MNKILDTTVDTLVNFGIGSAILITSFRVTGLFTVDNEYENEPRNIISDSVVLMIDGLLTVAGTQTMIISMNKICPIMEATAKHNDISQFIVSMPKLGFYGVIFCMGTYIVRDMIELTNSHVTTISTCSYLNKK